MTYTNFEPLPNFCIALVEIELIFLYYYFDYAKGTNEATIDLKLKIPKFFSHYFSIKNILHLSTVVDYIDTIYVSCLVANTNSANFGIRFVQKLSFENFALKFDSIQSHIKLLPNFENRTNPAENFISH